MMKRLFAKLKLWLSTLEWNEDPQGDYLLSLEHRIRRLEDAQRDRLRDTSDS